jgi:hypothetical protein
MQVSVKYSIYTQQMYMYDIDACIFNLLEALYDVQCDYIGAAAVVSGS